VFQVVFTEITAQRDALVLEAWSTRSTTTERRVTLSSTVARTVDTLLKGLGGSPSIGAPTDRGARCCREPDYTMSPLASTRAPAHAVAVLRPSLGRHRPVTQRGQPAAVRTAATLRAVRAAGDGGYTPAERPAGRCPVPTPHRHRGRPRSPPPGSSSSQRFSVVLWSSTAPHSAPPRGGQARAPVGNLYRRQLAITGAHCSTHSVRVTLSR